MSIATLEALSAGVPVVAMGTGGVSDVLDHGETGFLAQDAGEFAAHIARLLVDRPLREQMAAAATQRVDRFRWSRIVERHLELYDLATARVSAQRLALAA
jgi:glycosyltransferase involved in cell wall biosynthesis